MINFVRAVLVRAVIITQNLSEKFPSITEILYFALTHWPKTWTTACSSGKMQLELHNRFRPVSIFQMNQVEGENSMDIPKSIPPQYHKKYEEAASLIIPFCQEHLNEEYEELCIHALQKLCRKRTEPMSTGRANTQAAGIVYAITQNCGIVGNSARQITSDRRFHLSAATIGTTFGVSKGGAAEKAKLIKKELNITETNEEWFAPSERDGVRAVKDFKKLMSRLK